MSRIALTAVTPWITAATLAHPHDLAAHLMQRLSVSRRTAVKTISRLVETQWIIQQGTPRQPHHVPGLLRQVVQRYDLAGLADSVHGCVEVLAGASPGRAPAASATGEAVLRMLLAEHGRRWKL